jgi:hypothetical protein
MLRPSNIVVTAVITAPVIAECAARSGNDGK